MISGAQLIARIDGAVDVDPAVLADMEAGAVAFIQAQTRRYFGPVTETTEYVSGNCSRTLRLAEPAVDVDSDGEISLLEERAYPGGDPTTFGLADFGVRTIWGDQPSETVTLLVRGGGFKWTGSYEYAVTYWRGYDVDEGPDDIEQLVIDLVALKVKVNGQGSTGLRSETIGGYSYTRFGDTDLDAVGGWDTIRAWRRAVFA